MTIFAACLKTQLNSYSVNTQKVVIDDTQIPVSSTTFDNNHAAIANLLQSFFRIEDSDLQSLIVNIEPYPIWIGSIGAETNQSLSSFNEDSIRRTLKAVYADTSAPPRWGMTMDEAMDKVRLSALSGFISSNPPLGKEAYLYYDWYTLTLYRSTQSEIDAHNADGNSYVDMFDYLKNMIELSSPDSTLEDNGYSKATYNADSDTITFNSNFNFETW